MRSMRKLLMAVAALAVGVVVPARPAAAATPPSLGDFRLRQTELDLLGRVQRLDAELPKLGVQNLLLQANRRATWREPGNPCNPAAFSASGGGGEPGHWCWDAADAGTIGGDEGDGKVEWMPQGLTSTADAQADERWGERQALLVSWYDKRLAPEKGVRVTFLDPATGRYQHVLLAYPYTNSQGNPSYEILDSPQAGDNGGLHAGGIVWYGNYLYVADTHRGLRVFDMRSIFDLGSAGNGDTDDGGRIGRHDGTYYGFGYRYVMPQVDAWVNDVGPDNDDGNNCDPSGAPKFSYVALDRSATPDRLVTGEYCRNDPPVENGNGRVATWPLDGATGRPLLNVQGKWQATEAHRLPRTSIQGALVHNGTWYLSQSAGRTGQGYLVHATTSGTPTGTLAVTQLRRAGIGVEDLSYWPSQDALWTLTEHPGRRALYACPRTLPTGSAVCGAR